MPSWFLIDEEDRVIPAALQRSHTQPAAVAELILEAAAVHAVA